MKIAIVGLGVMGGSIARALVGEAAGDAAAPASVVGWAADAPDRMAAATHDVSVGEGLADTVDGADVVVLATPLSTLPDLAAVVGEAAPAGALMMDVASLQEPALVAAREASVADRWVSAHPMVGSERSGFGASRVDLYEGAVVFLSADPTVPHGVREAAVRFWSALGATPEWVDPDDHDDRMATVSHLPQVVAAALADTIAASGFPVDALGPGGRDTTRLAASSVTMWRDLFGHARPALVADLRALADRLEEDAAALERGDTGVPSDRLARAGAWRRAP